MKKILSIFLALVLLCTMLPTAAFAAEDPAVETEETFTTSTTYRSNGYAFDKVSHPESGTETTDGIVDYVGNSVVEADDEGQGDRGQSYSWSAIAYGDWIYIGTCYGALTNTLTLMKSALGDKVDADVIAAVQDVAFNGNFYFGEEDGGSTGGILVKVNTKTAEVKLLMSKASNGLNVMFRNAIEYKDKLYFCGSVNSLPCIYEVDPENDDAYKCVHQGMTLQEYYQTYMTKRVSPVIRGMCVYQGHLIVSCNGKDGAYIMMTDDPSEGFTTIATQEDLFDYPGYHVSDSIYGGSIWEMVEFNDSLYVSICTGTYDNMPDEYTMQSFAIVRGDPNGDGTFTWTAVVGDQEKDGAKYTFGIDPERTRAGAGVLKVYGDYLYIGEYNDEEIALENILFDPETGECPGLDFEFVNRNLEQSVSLYRMDKDENMELVMGDATEMFPNGSLSGLGSGFDKNENQYIWRMEEYDGKLYIGTFDTSSMLEPVGQFTNGDLLNMSEEEWESQLNYIKVLLEVLEDDGDGDGSEDASITTGAPVDNETAEQLVTAAVEAVKAEDGNAEIPVLNYLDAEQFEELQWMVREGLILPGSMEDALSEPIEELIKNLGDAQDALGDDYSDAFMDAYEEMYNRLVTLMEQYDDMDSELLEQLGVLLNNTSVEQLEGMATCMAYMSTAERGFDLYVTEDGVNFETITTDGFGDPYNHGLRVFATTDQGLTIGTANPFYGTQIWLMKNMYDITCSDGVTADYSEAAEGTTVTLTVEIPAGYEIKTLTAVTDDETEVALTKVDSKTYTFTMPASDVDVTVEFQKHQHNYKAYVHEPTCTDPGCTVYACNACGDTYTSNATDALGHDWDQGTVTKEPGCLTEGVKTYTCTRCGETKTEAIPATGSPFTDVTYSGSYYYTPVLWAVDAGIAKGITATTFEPLSTCTRAQVVVFLYRAAGEPQVSGTNPFTDVKEGDYYYNAVLWGYQNGIVKGTSETTFTPNATITRAQFITFLYRYADEPAVTDRTNPFVDVADGMYYTNAVLWGYQNGIVNGLDSTHFGPDENCTRGQVMTFLWRYLA